MLIEDPVPMGEPLPQPPAYHVYVPPEPPEADKVTVWPGHDGLGLAVALLGDVGLDTTVTVTLAQLVVLQSPSART